VLSELDDSGGIQHTTVAICGRPDDRLSGLPAPVAVDAPAAHDDDYARRQREATCSAYLEDAVCAARAK